jgi:hypothetical protein
VSVQINFDDPKDMASVFAPPVDDSSSRGPVDRDPKLDAKLDEERAKEMETQAEAKAKESQQKIEDAPQQDKVEQAPSQDADSMGDVFTAGEDLTPRLQAVTQTMATQIESNLKRIEDIQNQLAGMGGGLIGMNKRAKLHKELEALTGATNTLATRATGMSQLIYGEDRFQRSLDDIAQATGSTPGEIAEEMSVADRIALLTGGTPPTVAGATEDAKLDAGRRNEQKKREERVSRATDYYISQGMSEEEASQRARNNDSVFEEIALQTAYWTSQGKQYDSELSRLTTEYFSDNYDISVYDAITRRLAALRSGRGGGQGGLTQKGYEQLEKRMMYASGQGDVYGTSDPNLNAITRTLAIGREETTPRLDNAFGRVAANVLGEATQDFMADPEKMAIAAEAAEAAAASGDPMQGLALMGAKLKVPLEQQAGGRQALQELYDREMWTEFGLTNAMDFTKFIGLGVFKGTIPVAHLPSLVQSWVGSVGSEGTHFANAALMDWATHANGARQFWNLRFDTDPEMQAMAAQLQGTFQNNLDTVLEGWETQLPSAKKAFDLFTNQLRVLMLNDLDAAAIQYDHERLGLREKLQDIKSVGFTSTDRVFADGWMRFGEELQKKFHWSEFEGVWEKVGMTEKDMEVLANSPYALQWRTYATLFVNPDVFAAALDAKIFDETPGLRESVLRTMEWEKGHNQELNDLRNTEPEIWTLYQESVDQVLPIINKIDQNQRNESFLTGERYLFGDEQDAGPLGRKVQALMEGKTSDYTLDVTKRRLAAAEKAKLTDAEILADDLTKKGSQTPIHPVSGKPAKEGYTWERKWDQGMYGETIATTGPEWKEVPIK